MSTPELRSRLAAQQSELVQALVAGGTTPPGFDEERVRLAARSLFNKRLREIARAWPALAHCLGDSFALRFAIYTRTNPPPQQGGPLADGMAFAATVPPAELDDESRLEMLFVDLYHRRLTVRLRWLPGARRLVLGVRMPCLGVRLMSLRFRRVLSCLLD